MRFIKEKIIVPQPYSASIISLKRKNEVLKTILSLIFFFYLTEFKLLIKYNKIAEPKKKTN